MTSFSLRIEEKCTVNKFGRQKLGLNLSQQKKAKGLMFRSFNKQFYERFSQICGCDSLNYLLFSMSFNCQGEGNS